MKFRVPDIVLGAFLMVAVFAMGFVVSYSYYPPQQQQQTAHATDHKSSKVSSEERLADYTWWLAVLTAALAASTIGLWFVTGIGVFIQVKDTRILQRAYISVNPLGISSFTSGEPFFSCDVGFHNVGKLPARDVEWRIDRMLDDSGFFKTPEGVNPFEGHNVIAPGIEMRKGGKKLDEAYVNARRGWLYVWGEVRYSDGFERTRFTKFCFRYNMMGTTPGISFTGIPKENARYHIYGNDAD